MLNSSLLHITEDACIAALTLTEGMVEEDFLRSRLIRHEVRYRVLDLSRTAQSVPSELRNRMPELDWNELSILEAKVDRADTEADKTLWLAIRSQIPATLMWLRVYRKNEPTLFSEAD